MLSKKLVLLLCTVVLAGSACVSLELPGAPSDDATATGGLDSEGAGGHVVASGGVGAGAVDGGGGASGGHVPTGCGGPLGGFGGLGGSEFDGDLVATGRSEIWGLAATDTHVYWVEHGTEDPEDYSWSGGLLCSVELASGDIQTLADDLDGPTALYATTTDAYIGLSSSELESEFGDFPLGRVPLAGGPLEIVAGSSGNFAAYEDRAYLTSFGDESVYEYRPGQERRRIRSHCDMMAVDATHLYCWYNQSYLARQALAEAEEASEVLSTNHGRGVAVHGDLLLGGSPDGVQGGTVYLRAMPKAGGTWTNIVGFDEADMVVEVLIRGDRYFAMTNDSRSTYNRIFTGYIDDGDAEVVFAAYILQNPWDATEETFFVAIENRIYRLPLD